MNGRISDRTTDITVLQDGFDPLGPTVRQEHVSSGRTVNYIDDGAEGRHTLLFFGGAGTTVRAFRLLEFARSLRLQLQIRVVCVERNGLGQTPFDPAVGFGEYAADVWSLLDRLAIERVSVVAISGGGPYAAHVAAASPERVASMHLACAYSEPLASALPDFSVDDIAADPVSWWQFPDDSPVNQVPGFADSVIEEATRGVFARGRDTAPEGLAQAFELHRSEPLPDLSSVLAPTFLYWGTSDPLVPLGHCRRWQDALPNVAQARIYEGERHDVQYRHWDQILADVACLGTLTVVCSGGRTLLVPPERAEELLATGATLGLCAWS